MTPTVESSIQISSGAKGIQVSVHATAVTNAASTETIAVNSPGTNNNLRKDTVPATEKIIGHNQEIIQRNELKKAHASVLLEMQTPPTPAEAQRGIVYVQEHELGNGLFKIGWMEDTARVSIMHCESCSLPNSRVIYETPSGPFLAASKAKSLSQTALHPQTLGNRECHHCGRGCEEWVSAPVETVLEAVKTMEAFVKLPAYESKDGENWKLSSAADKMIRTMSVFSLERFKDTMDSAEENSTGKTVASLATRLSQETIACVDETVASPVSPNTETDFQEKETPTKSETKGSSKDSKSRRRFLANPAKKGKKIIDYMANLTGWDRSAESTPER
ncbi:hypothetical protein LZ31DRAFT_541718 [Colletotrichum somersetense]|nr:hypothetical protein LZ31DRAFT_541718 [Colletotrichum somersetense]